MAPTRPAELSQGDLEDVTRVHLQAFPEAILSRIGPQVVERYYAWQLSEPNDAHAVGVYEEGELAGFAVGGLFRNGLSGFVGANRRLILTSVARKPWLLLNKTFWNRLAMTIDAFKRANAKRNTPGNGAPQPAARKPRRRRYSVLSIAVDPANQRKGIGAVLLADQEARARELGHSEIFLTVQQDNRAAVRFYVRQGWTKVVSDGVWHGKMTKTLRTGGSADTVR